MSVPKHEPVASSDQPSAVVLRFGKPDNQIRKPFSEGTDFQPVADHSFQAAALVVHNELPAQVVRSMKTLLWLPALKPTGLVPAWQPPVGANVETLRRWHNLP